MSKVPPITFPSHASRMREEGQTMAEYTVVLGVITVTIVTAFAVLSSGIEKLILRVGAFFPL
jgi:Flp pilus assembly pilin Flp